jgi:hypothetical protein
MILAAGVVVNTLFSGVTPSALGAMPKLHCSMAPIHTCIGICFFLPIYELIAKARLFNTAKSA